MEMQLLLLLQVLFLLLLLLLRDSVVLRLVEPNLLSVNYLNGLLPLLNGVRVLINQELTLFILTTQLLKQWQQVQHGNLM